MFRKQNLLYKITEKLTWVRMLIEMHGDLYLYDTCTIAEGFMAEVLNIVYDYSLINLNYLHPNHPGADLGDRNQGIAFQVTAEKTKRKIQNTIDQYIKRKLYEKFQELRFFILQDSYKPRSSFDTKEYFEFDKDKHILDFSRLMKRIGTLPTEKLQQLADYLEEEVRTENHETTNVSSPSLTSEQEEVAKKLAELGRNWKENFYMICDPDTDWCDILGYDDDPPLRTYSSMLTLERAGLITLERINKDKSLITLEPRLYDFVDANIQTQQEMPMRNGMSEIKSPLTLKIQLYKMGRDQSLHNQIGFETHRALPQHMQFGIALVNMTESTMASGISIRLEFLWRGHNITKAPSFRAPRKAGWETQVAQLLNEQPAVFVFRDNDLPCFYHQPISWGNAWMTLEERLNGTMLIKYMVSSIKPHTDHSGELTISLGDGQTDT